MPPQVLGQCTFPAVYEGAQFLNSSAVSFNILLVFIGLQECPFLLTFVNYK